MTSLLVLYEFYLSGWWENFVSGNSSAKMQRLQNTLDAVRDTSNFLSAPIRIGFIIVLAK